MNRYLLVIAPLFVMTLFSNHSVLTEHLPASVLQAFLSEHPRATHSQYRFMADDAGILFLVDFEEAGEQMHSEYRYELNAWLSDSKLENEITSVDEENPPMHDQYLQRTQF